MKVICIDNFQRSKTKEVLIMERLTEKKAIALSALMNALIADSDERYYIVVADEYQLNYVTPECCCCGTKEGLRRDGRLGWRCNADDCLPL